MEHIICSAFSENCCYKIISKFNIFLKIAPFMLLF
ncbi:hypothetical protein CbuG_0078 [Coxiella burnetii CbuG_Q212]|nr:hypothetical protein CbuG_0078 [Coxiella burnetii CbuG_Q212]